MRKTLAVSIAIAWIAVGRASVRSSLAQPILRPSIPCQGGWTNSKLPSVGAHTVLHDVTALSRTDVWAVGEIGLDAVAMHFDGESWSLVPTPTDAGSLFGVAGASSDDVWAVGLGGPEGVGVVHWDGAAWSSVPTPSPGPYGGELFDVAAIASNDAWAVGIAYTAEEGSATLTEHWDGTAWTIVPSPSAFSNSYLRAVSADSPSDVWALGLAEVDRWDGSAWTLEFSVPQSWNKFFLDVAAFGPDDVWVTGYRLFPQTQPAFAHWDGTAWKVTIAQPVPRWGEMFGIGGPSSDRLWAVGQQSTGVLMERWNGTSWQVVPAPSPPGNTAMMWDVTVDSDGVGWAVGTTGGREYPLIEHTCPH